MGFEFAEKSAAELEICGAVYAVDPYSEKTLAAMREYRQGITAAAEKDASAMPTIENVRAVNALCGTMVDAVLGKGVYDALFEGKKDDFIAHQELASYIIATLTAFIGKRLAGRAAEAAREVRTNDGQVNQS